MSDGNPFRRLAPGSNPSRFPRRAFNALLDGLADAQQEQFGQSAGTPRASHSSTVVTVRNSSGAPADRFGVLQLGDPLVTAAQNATEFANRITFEGLTPSDAAAPFCVLLEPLPDGEIGRGVLMGAVPCLLDVASESHDYAGPVVGETGRLRTAASGPARVLWVEDAADGEGTAPVLRDAYVMLSGAAGATFSGARVTLTANQSVTGFGGVVSWDEEVYDTDGYHSNVTNPRRLTIPADGWYMMGCTYSLSPFVPNVNGGNVAFQINGVLGINCGFQQIPHTTFGGQAQHSFPGRPTYFTAGDYIELVFALVPSDTYTFLEGESTFWIYKLQGFATTGAASVTAIAAGTTAVSGASSGNVLVNNSGVLGSASLASMLAALGGITVSYP